MGACPWHISLYDTCSNGPRACFDINNNKDTSDSVASALYEYATFPRCSPYRFHSTNIINIREVVLGGYYDIVFFNAGRTYGTITAWEDVWGGAASSVYDYVSVTAVIALAR